MQAHEPGEVVAPTVSAAAGSPEMTANLAGETELELREDLARHTREDVRAQFGAVSEAWCEYATGYFWEEANQDERIRQLVASGMKSGARILDIAGGHGQFLFRALEAGYDAVGVEPDTWKVAFAARKLRATNRHIAWGERLVRAFGECLPFEDASFDAVTSFQTLEHVQDPGAVVREMVRVTRQGGIIHVQCPDYRSLFEGHYQLPWLPKMPRSLARIYLGLLGRPAEGLAQIQYVTRPLLVALFEEASRSSGRRVHIENCWRSAYENGLKRRGLPRVPGGYSIWRAIDYARVAFRQEVSVNLLVRA
jgi:SAM-dependent methyltransferase